MNNSTFVYTIYIASTPEKIWEALTNGEITEKYFFGSKIQSDWQEGSSVTYSKLTLKHEGLLETDIVDYDNTFEGFNNGWPAILSNLKSLLETERTLPIIPG